jgi:hypothetical protein
MCFLKEFIVRCVHAKWQLRGLALKHFSTTLEEEESIEGYRTDIYFCEEKVVCALFLSNHLALAK